eukprot:CAMPEP_0184386906 /NCGR_PEP_ID=MMETSP0007-20130409/10238_1 /TAXON_ID=97485 /ORGANISM="Prymnesium parvum, Strain Texoma1" /LENGTH=236 /DNA_ID=CAMNT_0026735009 /DNA_START=20 /DNA_END=730 /DNA_ORIENTATION=+
MADAPSPSPSADIICQESILVLHNVSKRKNFGELLRTAAAMGVCEVVVVGASKLSSHGAHGCGGHLRFSHFVKLYDAVSYLHHVRNAVICGVEISPSAEPVQKHPFRRTGATAFMMGNEGTGLLPAQLEVCDHFVYIPQHSGSTASLNVNAACAIVLHQFAQWAGFPEAPRDGHKYVQVVKPSAIPHSGLGLKQMRTLMADGTIAHRAGETSDGDDSNSGQSAVDLFCSTVLDEEW